MTTIVAPKISPFLWFDTQAEEAAKFYCSVFPDSSFLGVSRYGDAGPGPKGTVMTATWELFGLQFTGINGGPIFQFTEAVSFQVSCKDQVEVDHYWTKLTKGGKPSQCGWLKDKYGLSWQIVPERLTQLLTDKDAKRAARVMQAMLTMKKIDIATLEKAAAAK
jgi:predicted 3-demethylubiquinone-9 3-methyltransferase (glyoxalase superfamily)